MIAKKKKAAAQKKPVKKPGGEDIVILPAQKPAPAKGKRHEKRDIARSLFLSGTRTAKEIADALGVSEQSISKWRIEDDWDEHKAIFNTTPAELIKRFTAEIQQILDEQDAATGKKKRLDPGKIDSIKKLTKSIKELRNQLDPQTIMEALDGYMAYLAEFDLALSQANVKHAIAYVQMRMKESKLK